MASATFKTGLILLAQLKLTQGMVILPRSSVSCDYQTAAASGDTCTSFAAEWGLTEETFASINPGITCPNLVSGQDYCVVGTVTSTGPTTTASSTVTTSAVTSSTSSSTSSSSSSLAPYQPQQSGTAATCDQYHLVGDGDSCSAIESQYDISLTEFLAWNPSLNSDCTNLLVGYYYCVNIPGATKVTTTTTTVPVTTTPADGITAPSPVQTGITATCNKFDLVQSGDTCAVIANKYNIPLASFYDWNPAVGSSCAHLDVGDYVCVDIIGYTATTSTTTTSSGNGIPTPNPFEPGMVDDCTTFYFVSSGDTCAGIARSNGVTVAQVTHWNPKVRTGCTDLWLHEYICVGV
ncbi:unnamed protein product [Penicillium bialowiezense]